MPRGFRRINEKQKHCAANQRETRESRLLSACLRLIRDLFFIRMNQRNIRVNQRNIRVSQRNLRSGFAKSLGPVASSDYASAVTSGNFSLLLASALFSMSSISDSSTLRDMASSVTSR